MNIFQDGIKPMWEDNNLNNKNKGGKYFQLDYQVQKDKIEDFVKAANFNWRKLAVLCLMLNLLMVSDSLIKLILKEVE